MHPELPTHVTDNATALQFYRHLCLVLKTLPGPDDSYADYSQMEGFGPPSFAPAMAAELDRLQNEAWAVCGESIYAVALSASREAYAGAYGTPERAGLPADVSAWPEMGTAHFHFPFEVQPVLQDGFWSWQDAEWADGGHGMPYSAVEDYAPVFGGDIVGGKWLVMYILPVHSGGVWMWEVAMRVLTPAELERLA